MVNSLRVARKARGWSQARLVHEIERRRAAAGLGSATRASLKVYVSEWENGRRVIGDDYRGILRTIFGLTDGELLGKPGDMQSEPLNESYAELAAQIDASASLGVGMVETLSSQTELLRTMDRQMGAAGLVDQMRVHLETLENALAYSVLPTARRPVAAVLSGAATLAGWQALDVGAVDRAWRNYELARRSATEAESPTLIAHAMGEQAYVLVDAGRLDLAVALIGEAINLASGRAPGRLIAWLRSVDAEFQALAGNVSACRIALDQAAAALPPGSDMRDPEVPGVFLNDTHLGRWRGNALALIGEGSALDDLYAALAGMDATFTRAEASVRIDLASAHLARGEIGEAENQARKARLIIGRTGSLRNRRRLDRLALRFAAD